MERGLDAGIAKYGGDHQYVIEYRDALLDVQLELGKLAEAEKNLAAMDRIWRKDPARHALSLAMIHGHSSARILVDRKRAAAAERLTRASLATWTELHGDDGPRAYLTFQLGIELAEQRRWSEARAVLAEATKLGAAMQLRGDFQAEVDVQLARIDAATGQRANAVERARRAREVLAHYPMALHSHRELAKLLDKR